jgi:hypothetical protein
MLNATERAFRISKLDAVLVKALNALSTTPKSLATIAAAYGATQDIAEKHLSILIDEGLCTRTKGSRLTATYIGQ